MVKKIKFLLKKFKTKWYKGECRHFCVFCKYSPYCQGTWEDTEWSI